MQANQVQLVNYDKAYFVGVGGIGMSALARYFNDLGWSVGGYDRTATGLTEKLVKEGVHVHYEDLGATQLIDLK